MSRAVRPGLALCFLFLFAVYPAACVNVSLPTQIAGRGGSILLPISFSADGESAAAVQFDLEFDSSVLSFSPVIGAAARTSGKSVYVAEIGANVARIIIFQVNQNTIVDGSLVDLFVNIAPAASPGNYPIHFQFARAVDALGNPLGMGATDGTVTVIDAAGAPVAADGVRNGASLLGGPVAPGEVVTIMGSALGPPVTPATPQITFSGFPAALLYVSPGQINAVVPFEIDGLDQTILEIAHPPGSPVGIALPVTAASPAIFTLDGTGVGQGAILNQDNTINSPAHPAARGSILVMYATGAGQTNPPSGDGSFPTPDLLPAPRLPVSVQIGGVTAEVLYAGAAPYMISGVIQVNCRVPPGISPGIAVPVVMSVGPVSSPPATASIQ